MIYLQPTVRLIRLEENYTFGTFGALIIDSQVFCATLEPPDKLNEKNKSSIPAQQYQCVPHNSPKFGKTYLIKDVPGRSDCLFHPGNTIYDTEGCIITGRKWGVLGHKNRAVLNSGETFKEFMWIMSDNDFHLSIINCF